MSKSMRFYFYFLLSLLFLFVIPARLSATHRCIKSLLAAANSNLSDNDVRTPEGIYKLDLIRIGEKIFVDSNGEGEKILAGLFPHFASGQALAVDEIGFSITGEDFVSARGAILNYLIATDKPRFRNFDPSFSQWVFAESNGLYDSIRWLPPAGIAAAFSISVAQVLELNPQLIVYGGLGQIAASVCAVGTNCVRSFLNWKRDGDRIRADWDAFKKKAEEVLDPAYIPDEFESASVQIDQKWGKSKSGKTDIRFFLEAGKNRIPELTVRIRNNAPLKREVSPPLSFLLLTSK